MRVYNLACHNDHSFEGWFASSEAYERQQMSRLVNCPICDSTAIEKRLHAPYVNTATSAASRGQPGRGPLAQTPTSQPAVAQNETLQTEMAQKLLHSPNISDAQKWAGLQALLAQKIREATDDVGANFAEEARAIHYDEKQARGIRGLATREETLALLDEGIAVTPIPFSIDPPDLH